MNQGLKKMVTRNNAWPCWAFDSTKFKLNIKIPFPHARNLDSYDAKMAYYMISTQHSRIQGYYAAAVIQTQFNRHRMAPPDGYKENIDQLEKDYNAFYESYVIYCLTYQ